ncbi:MAG: sulfite exporter TauE/SafE family protein [Lachnospiraceae bacterium]|nr:sulfite exporter TauE/SafE family protein [Lachnospiraceae bacterium]
MNKQLRLHIDGMTCINCQNKIEETLQSTKGVLWAKVRYAKGTADVGYDDSKVTVKKIKKAIEDLDYKVVTAEEAKAFDVGEVIVFGSVIVMLYYVLQTMGILNRLAPSRVAESGMGYGMLFVIGLITSVHCVAMCGGIGLSQSLPTGTTVGNKSKWSAYLPNLAYNLGRVCSYTVIGFLLGTIGMLIGGDSGVGMSTTLQGIVKLAAGAFMVIMGINLLGIFPALRRINIHTPMFIAKIIGNKRRNATQPFVIGLLNGLMPCGPLQSMWIVAFATASPFAGALSMFLFSLGTVPLMLGLGSVVSALGKKFTQQVMRIGAVLVVVMGLAMMNQGGNLTGLRLFPTPQTPQVASAPVEEAEETEEVASESTGDSAIEGVEIVDGVQIVNSSLAGGRYPMITVQKGIPVRWTINAPEGSLSGCNYRMIIPEYNIQYEFGYGDNVIEFTPEESGVVPYSCWMGMIQRAINVVE